MKDFDFFVSHATEDKADAAVPIADGLLAKGYRVWLDKGALTVGDRLLRSINTGLSRCRFGVVILSPDFFKKDWPQWELEGLLALETSERRKVILPVWHRIGFGEIAAIAPILAGRLATQTSHGIDHVVDDLVHALNAGAEGLPISSPPRPPMPSVDDVLRLEPLDLYADAEEQMELGQAAAVRIAAGMAEFTAQANALGSEIHALTAANQQLPKRVVRAKINEYVPIFDAYRRVLEENAHILGETTGNALLLMTRGLVLDKGDTHATRLSWLSTIENVERAVGESRAVQEQARSSTNNLRGYTGAFKGARNDLMKSLTEFVDAHEQALADLREAKLLLRPEPELNAAVPDESVR